MEITGKVVAVQPVENGTSKSGKAWQKQCFVIATEGQYPKNASFQLFGDKVKMCPKVGEEAKVQFDIESREWQGKWFTQLNAWKVEVAGQSSAPSAEPSAAPPDDDFPF
ncbi:MAG: DUF3127 domain-containing protein [Muribaculaceae bacterium]|nr:DUF3127 domain-containing protein [Muribaculaceae bacterium]